MAAQAVSVHWAANYNVSVNAIYLHIFGCIIQLCNFLAGIWKLLSIITSLKSQHLNQVTQLFSI